MKEQIKIGSRIKLNAELKMHNITYPIGHQFVIVSDSGYRGWDIRDDDGNMVYECLFIQDTFELFDLDIRRDEKIDVILGTK